MLWELSVTGQRCRAVLEVMVDIPGAEVVDRTGTQ
jgi:hypothetical protein